MLDTYSEANSVTSSLIAKFNSDTKFASLLRMNSRSVVIVFENITIETKTSSDEGVDTVCKIAKDKDAPIPTFAPTNANTADDVDILTRQLNNRLDLEGPEHDPADDVEEDSEDEPAYREYDPADGVEEDDSEGEPNRALMQM